MKRHVLLELRLFLRFQEFFQDENDRFDDAIADCGPGPALYDLVLCLDLCTFFFFDIHTEIRTRSRRSTIHSKKFYQTASLI